jgi:hypothetical protein
VEVVPEADHFYSGVRDELCRRIVNWLNRPLGTFVSTP